MTHRAAQIQNGDNTARTGATVPRPPTTARRRTTLALTAGIGTAALMLSAPAVAGPLALTVRVGDHAATVRVVVDLTGPRIPAGRIIPGVGDVYSTGTASFIVDVGGANTRVSTASGLGVRVTITRNHNRLAIRTVAAPGRFKYVQWSTLGAPSRVVIDLWKAAPPFPAANIRSASCLSLHAVSPSPGTVAVAGKVVGSALFENQFAVNVRSTTGAIVGHRTVSAQPGAAWRVWVPYHVASRPIRQAGTLEAVAFAGNGNITCLTQQVVWLQP